MRINNNMSAVITNNKLLGTESSLSDVMEKLSSGFSINHASDNPSGIAIAGKMQAQIDGLDQASTNGSDGISVLQTAEGALNEVTEMIQRMRELAVQAANGTNSDYEREEIQKEISSLLEEIDRVATSTEFNTITLLDGSCDCRTYGNDCTRIATSNKVPEGIYQLRITQAALQASATTTLAGGYTITTTSNDTVSQVETTITATLPAWDYTTSDHDYKSFIDSTIWTTSERDYSSSTGTVTIVDAGSGLGLSGSITINGYPLVLAQGSSGEMVYGQLRAACEKGGAILSDYDDENGLSISSYKYGKDAELVVEFSSVEFAKALGFDESILDVDDSGNILPTVNQSGVDAKMVLYKDNMDDSGNSVTSLFGKQSTYETDGRRVTVTDTNGFEISFLSDVGYTGEIAFNVTDIGSMNLQIGANEGQSMEVRIACVNTQYMYIDDVDVTRQEGPEDAMDALEDALSYVTAVRSQLGAYENRLDHTTKSLDTTEENMTSAISRIEDADMATTMVEYTKLNVLEQAGVSALAQANELPQLALQLLQ